jgi:phenylalanyl-tRNA synthetase beta subunit
LGDLEQQPKREIRRLIFQAPDRTLTSEEVDQSEQVAVNRLIQDFQIELRK